MKKSVLIALLALMLGSIPFGASAAPEDELYNCNTSGQATTGAGSTKPLGSPYVPVVDYTVELNTGLLVYKECVLREIVTAQRKKLLSELDTEVLKQFNSYPSREMGKEDVFLSDRTVSRYLKNTSLSNFNDAIEGKVKNWIGRAYNYARDPRLAFECKYNGDLNDVYEGTPEGNYWEAFDAVTDNPACSVFSASVLAYTAVEEQAAYELYKQHERLDWGQGVNDVFHYDENGFHITDTPGAVVLANGILSVQSGYVQAQQADDLNEITQGLYRSVTNQVLSGGQLGSGTGGSAGSVGGLAGITQALSGALSYMEQVQQLAGGALVTQTGNFVLDKLRAAIKDETDYRNILIDTVTMYTTTTGLFRDAETQCYTAIKNAVCDAGSITSTSCTKPGGGTLTFIQETTFSQAVVSTYTSLATALPNKINQAKTNIDALIALRDALLANPTAAQQTIALAGLTAIQLHNPQTEKSNFDAEKNRLSTLLSSTDTAWKTGKHWCNVEDADVKASWITCWSGGACPTS